MQLDSAGEGWVRKMEKYAGDDLEMIFKKFQTFKTIFQLPSFEVIVC